MKNFTLCAIESWSLCVKNSFCSLCVLASLRPCVKFFVSQLQQQQTLIAKAVASAGQSAAIVSFQRHEGSHPPDKNINSVAVAGLSAMQFSGSIAVYAIFAAKIAFCDITIQIGCSINEGQITVLQRHVELLGEAKENVLLCDWIVLPFSQPEA